MSQTIQSLSIISYRIDFELTLKVYYRTTQLISAGNLNILKKIS